MAEGGGKPRYLKKCLDADTGAKYLTIKHDLFECIPFKRGKNLGSSDSKEVYLMEGSEDPSNLQAAKVFHFKGLTQAKLERTWRSFLAEAGHMQKLNHENVVKMTGPLACPAYAVILMEYYPDGPLYDHLDTLEDRHLHRYFVQILCALKHMHAKRIVHRDVKLDNILVRGHTVHLTDFGLSKQLAPGDTLVTGKVGTPMFMAPEVRAAKRDTSYDGFKADSYSTGVFVWCMLMGEEPENRETDLLREMHENEKDVDPVLSSCARLLLEKNPDLRWDITLLLDYLKTNGYRSWQIDMLSY